MKPTADNNSYVLPPALLAEVEAAATEEHRPVADVVRDALESYLSTRHPSPVVQSVSALAKRTPAQAAARLRELRQETPLPEGMTIRDMMTHGRA